MNCFVLLHRFQDKPIITNQGSPYKMADQQTRQIYQTALTGDNIYLIMCIVHLLGLERVNKLLILYILNL